MRKWYIVWNKLFLQRSRTHEFFVDTDDVGTGLPDQPLLAGLASDAVSIFVCPSGAQTKRGVGLDDVRPAAADNTDLHAGCVSTRAKEEPFLSQAISMLG